jgi:hypothetical protein
MNRRYIFTLAAVLAMCLGSIRPCLADAPLDRSQLVGRWVNVNDTTGGIIRIRVTDGPAGFQIHEFGRCHPTPCDLGVINAAPFSKSVGSSVATGLSATYTFAYATILFTAKLVSEYDGGSFLEVETRTTFAPGDQRKDYTSTQLFQRR